jgi:hypothetical protein
MEKPFCKICQQKHWQRDQHIWKDSVEIVSTAGDEILTATKEILSIPVKPKEIRLKEARAAFDRVTYQREYMRKRRAKLKNA